MPSNDNVLHALDPVRAHCCGSRRAAATSSATRRRPSSADRIYIGCLGDNGEVRCLGRGWTRTVEHADRSHHLRVVTGRCRWPRRHRLRERHALAARCERRHASSIRSASRPATSSRRPRRRRPRVRCDILRDGGCAADSASGGAVSLRCPVAAARGEVRRRDSWRGFVADVGIEACCRLGRRYSIRPSAAAGASRRAVTASVTPASTRTPPPIIHDVMRSPRSSQPRPRAMTGVMIAM
jgi:hypothetical protein